MRVIRYVIDASVAAEYLLRTPLGLQIVPLIEQAFLLAPELLDVEVVSVLRRAVLQLVQSRTVIPQDFAAMRLGQGQFHHGLGGMGIFGVTMRVVVCVSSIRFTWSQSDSRPETMCLSPPVICSKL